MNTTMLDQGNDRPTVAIVDTVDELNPNAANAPFVQSQVNFPNLGDVVSGASGTTGTVGTMKFGRLTDCGENVGGEPTPGGCGRWLIIQRRMTSWTTLGSTVTAFSGPSYRVDRPSV